MSLLYNCCKQTVYKISEKCENAFFSLYFAKSMGGIVADRVLESFKPTDS